MSSWYDTKLGFRVDPNEKELASQFLKVLGVNKDSKMTEKIGELSGGSYECTVSGVFDDDTLEMENVLEKPQEDISEYLDNPDEYLSLGLADFARAFNQFLMRKQRIEETRRRYTRIERERETMESRMEFIRDTFIRALDSGDITEKDFRELIPHLGRSEEGRYDTIVSFTSLLQMMRDRYLDADQKETYGRITVRPGEVDLHTYNAEAASAKAVEEGTE